MLDGFRSETIYVYGNTLHYTNYKTPKIHRFTLIITLTNTLTNFIDKHEPIRSTILAKIQRQR
jgi:hypothetical protein